MDREYADSYGHLEEHHWWFTARREILSRLLRQVVDWHEARSVLEVGVGAGSNLYSLYPDPSVVAGLEPDEVNLEVARERGDIPVYHGVVEAMPEPLASERFDVVTMFDVLEHIEDDDAALQELRDRMRPGGRLVLTVPAYMWMWGRQDEVSHHFRRYTLAELRAKLEDNGFRVARATYFNTLLFFPIAAIRLASKIVKMSARSDFDFRPGRLNALLHRVFAAEAAWLARWRFPFGVSIFVAAEKWHRGAFDGKRTAYAASSGSSR